MRFGSLFAGIGGLDLGLERAGMEVRWQAESDPYCMRVLEKHWPDVTRYGDVTAVDWKDVERVDLICGGFPCQPVSVAGKQLGQDDDRWLWPEFARCVCILRPAFVLVENVPGILTRGMGDVLGDLAGLGYDAEWASVPACALGAPHSRPRVFIVAHADGEGWRWLKEYDGDPPQEVAERETRDDPYRQGVAYRGPWARELRPVGLADGVPGGVARRRVAGNAVVPQVAEWVGRRIVESHHDTEGCPSIGGSQVVR